MATLTLINEIYITTAPESDITDSVINNSENYIIVRISMEKFSRIYLKPPIIIPIPVDFGAQPSAVSGTNPDEATVDAATKTLIKDLLDIKETFTVDGWLEDDDTESAFTKAAAINRLMRFGGSVRVINGAGAVQKVFSAVPIKAEVIEGVGKITGEGGNLTASPDKSYHVSIQLIRGTDR